MSRRKPRSTVPVSRPAKQVRRSTPLPPRAKMPRPPARALPPRPQPRVEIPSLVSSQETSLVDVVDNLLNRGVVLNADLILAMGPHHPPTLNDEIQVDRTRVALAVLALLMLIVCFTPAPIEPFVMGQ